jgi:multidrug resistance efflux pump
MTHWRTIPLVRLTLAVVACTAAIAAWSRLRPDPDVSLRPTVAADSPASTDTVTRGTFVHVLRLNGLVEAVAFASITAPRIAGQGGQQLVIQKLVPKGTLVRKGDLVVEFDRQQQLRTAEDKRAEWLDLDEQIRKKAADQAAQAAKDETEVKAAENALELAKLDLLKNEMLPRIEAAKNELTREAAEAKLAQLRQTLTLKRAADRADVRILEVRRDRANLTMRQAESNAEKMAIRAPIDGLIVLKTTWRNGGQNAEIQEGQDLWSGSAVMDVVGAGAMRVRVKVNQVDIARLRLGQPAAVRLDAYPEQAYAAILETISPVAVPSTFAPKVKTFTAVFRIDRTDATLTPDLSAAVDVEVDRREHVLLAPRESVEMRAGKAFLHVRGAPARPVAIGPMNDRHVVIASGADVGTPVDTVDTVDTVAASAGPRARGSL